MNTQSDITDDEDMPADGALKNEKVLGAEAREAISRAEKLFDKHAQLVEQIHPAIIKVGEKLQVGRDLYEYDNNGFSEWISRNKLDRGRIFGRQQERTAAMTIYKLITFGYVEDLDTSTQITLDLSDCHRARPTDIIDWARKNQPDLFADLRAKRAGNQARLKGKKKPAKADKEEFEPDDVGDLDDDEDQWIAELRANYRAAQEEIQRLRARIAELEQQIANLQMRLASKQAGLG